MRLTNFSIIWAMAYAGFGFGLLLIPEKFMGSYGVILDQNGQLMAQVLGVALIAFALTFWFNRKLPSNNKAWRNLLLSSTIYNLVDIPIVLMATLNGVMNSLGWIPVALHVFLAITMGYFSYKKEI